MDLLPPPNHVFTEDFFNMPMFPESVLYEVATLFGVVDSRIHFTILKSAEDAEKKTDISRLIWFCSFMEIDPVYGQSFFYKFKQKRVFVNTLINPGPRRNNLEQDQTEIQLRQNGPIKQLQKDNRRFSRPQSNGSRDSATVELKPRSTADF